MTTPTIDASFVFKDTEIPRLRCCRRAHASADSPDSALSDADRDTPEPFLDELVSDSYPDLMRLAGRIFAGESPGHLLEPAALVSEAYLRLTAQRTVWKSRAQFFAVAARIMRRLLIDHARRLRAAKRVRIESPVELRFVPPPDVEAMTLEQALARLARRSSRQHDVVRLRCVVGLTVAETANELNVSPATVKLDWRLACRWLTEQLTTH